MRVVCIGGVCDGVRIEIPIIYARVGDSFRAEVPSHLKALPEMFDLDKLPETITISYHMYTLRLLCYGNGKGKEPNKLYFLAPPDWSDWEAIEFQMRK